MIAHFLILINYEIQKDIIILLFIYFCSSKIDVKFDIYLSRGCTWEPSLFSFDLVLE